MSISALYSERTPLLALTSNNKGKKSHLFATYATTLTLIPPLGHLSHLFGTYVTFSVLTSPLRHLCHFFATYPTS